MSSQTVTPLPAARPSAFTTTPRRSAGARQLAGERQRRLQLGERSAAGHAHVRPPRPLRGRRTCWTRSAPRPAPDRRPARRPRPADQPLRPPAGPPAPPRPDPRSSARARATTAAGSMAETSATQRTLRSSSMAWLPGATITTSTSASRARLQSQRVLASARPQDEHPGRSGGRRAGAGRLAHRGAWPPSSRPSPPAWPRAWPPASARRCPWAAAAAPSARSSGAAPAPPRRGRSARRTSAPTAST